jgi:hypothetical protein
MSWQSVLLWGTLGMGVTLSLCAVALDLFLRGGVVAPLDLTIRTVVLLLVGTVWGGWFSRRRGRTRHTNGSS